jgi:hypothetical protein
MTNPSRSQSITERIPASEGRPRPSGPPTEGNDAARAAHLRDIVHDLRAKQNILASRLSGLIDICQKRGIAHEEIAGIVRAFEAVRATSGCLAQALTAEVPLLDVSTTSPKEANHEC